MGSQSQKEIYEVCYNGMTIADSYDRQDAIDKTSDYFQEIMDGNAGYENVVIVTHKRCGDEVEEVFTVYWDQAEYDTWLDEVKSDYYATRL